MNQRSLAVTCKRIGGYGPRRKFQAVVRDLTTNELLFQCSHLHHWEHRPPTGTRATSAYRCGYEVLQKIKAL